MDLILELGCELGDCIENTRAKQECRKENEREDLLKGEATMAAPDTVPITPEIA